MSDEAEKKQPIQWEKIVKKAKSIGGIEEIEVNLDFGFVKVKFFKEEVEKTSKKPYTRKETRRAAELAEKIKQEAEIDEMSIMDPAAYEEQLAQGNLVEE